MWLLLIGFVTLLSSHSVSSQNNKLTKINTSHHVYADLLQYADVSCFDELWVKLEWMQDLCIRFIFGLRYFNHVSEFQKTLNSLFIRWRRDIHMLSYSFQSCTNPISLIPLWAFRNFLSQESLLQFFLVRAPSHRTNDLWKFLITLFWIFSGREPGIINCLFTCKGSGS